jgi:hypothetical protein
VVSRVFLLALAMGCTFAPTSTRAWSMPPEGEAVEVSRRWPARVPTIEGAHRVAHYRLRHGGTVLFFRFSGSLDEATASLLVALEEDGWELREHHGAGRIRSLTGCVKDCETERFYVVVKQELVGNVHAIVRMIGPAEFSRRVRLPGGCETVALARELELQRGVRVQPVRDVDLDRDGRLDAFVPRLGDVVLPGETQPRVVWDALVMRDGCGHDVGTFTEVPYDDHFAVVGPRGLLDLTVRSRKVIDGKTVRVVERMRFSGTRYEEQ